MQGHSGRTSLHAAEHVPTGFSLLITMECSVFWPIRPAHTFAKLMRTYAVLSTPNGTSPDRTWERSTNTDRHTGWQISCVQILFLATQSVFRHGTTAQIHPDHHRPSCSSMCTEQPHIACALLRCPVQATPCAKYALHFANRLARATHPPCIVSWGSARSSAFSASGRAMYVVTSSFSFCSFSGTIILDPARTHQANMHAHVCAPAGSAHTCSRLAPAGLAHMLCTSLLARRTHAVALHLPARRTCCALAGWVHYRGNMRRSAGACARSACGSRPGGLLHPLV